MFQTFNSPPTTTNLRPSQEAIYVPDAVISMSMELVDKDKAGSAVMNLSKALNRFSREDPTFRLSFDEEAKEVSVLGKLFVAENFLKLSGVFRNFFNA